MILKLKRKFIIINMCLVSAVMIIVFILILGTNFQRLSHETYDTLSKASMRDIGKTIPAPHIGDKPDFGRKPMFLTPIFSAQLNNKNEVIQVARENITVDDGTVSTLVEKVLKEKKSTGIMLNQQLVYQLQVDSTGTKIIFADISRDIHEMTSMGLTLLLVGLGGLGAFFIISVYLASWALRPVAAAWKQQEQFVADASHELRTPLTVILANSGILLSHKKDTIEEQSKWIENTQTEANRMKKLIDDLLFLAKSDASQGAQAFLPVNLSDLAWNSVLPFESVAFEKGIEIENEIESELFCNGNEGQLKQLLVIFLDNACKYSGTGKRILLKLEKAENHIILSVNNTGSLIPPEHLNNIFGRFYRSDSSRARESGGYGLGLSIAKTIVDRHQGSLTVTSSEEAGTTFTVRLQTMI